MWQDIDYLLEKRMQTIMIGSLARFEEHFDYLWQKENDPKSDAFLDLWQKTRQDILDYGNNQIRLAKKDLYNISDRTQSQDKPKYRYHYKFNLRRDNNEY